MRILVTGGTGFIGRVLCQRLLEQGAHLTLLSRQPARARALFPQDIGVIVDLDQLAPNDQFDAVVNLAGEPIMDARWTAQRKQMLLDSRVGLTHRLVDFMAAAERKPSVLISGSAVGWYGDRGDAILDESYAEESADFGHRLCQRWEHAAWEAEPLGIRVCLLRTGLVIGRDGGFLARLLPIFRLGLGTPLGSGRQWMSWIHRDDHVEITRKLLGDPELQGVFNLTAPKPVTNTEFTHALAGALQRPSLPPMLPGWALRLIIGERAELLLGSQRALPERIVKAGYVFQFPKLEMALAEVIGQGAEIPPG